MYNELWRRARALEALQRDATAISNATRRELQDGLRSVAVQLGRYCSLQADKAAKAPAAPKGIGARGGDVEATLEEIRSSMSSYFQTIISTQHMFQDTCHRIQEYEPMLEKYLAETLERIVGLLTANKCQSQVEDLHRLLKSHHSTIVRNVGHTTNTVLRAASNSSKETQNLATVINEVHDGLADITTDIQKGISRVQNEQYNVHQALKELITTTNYLQSQVSNLTNRSSSDGAHTTKCEDSIQTINLKSELLQISEDNKKHISSEIKNLTDSLTETLKTINAYLSSVHKQGDTQDLTNLLAIGKEQDYEVTSEQGTVLEAHENLNSIHDSVNSQQELSVIQNMSTSQAHKNQLETPQTHNPNRPYEENSSPELTINIIQNPLYASSKEQINSINTENQTLSLNPNTETGKYYGSGHIAGMAPNGTFITIVHNDKPLTSEGQITYSSKQNTSVEVDNAENSLQKQIYIKKMNKEQLPLNNQQFLDISKNQQTRKNNSSISGAMVNSNNTTYIQTDKISSNNILSINQSQKQHNNETHYSSTHNQDQTNKLTDDHHTNTSQHGGINASRNMVDSSENNPSSKLEDNLGTKNMNNSTTGTSKTVDKSIKHRSSSKNNTQHYLHHLLSTLEELKKRLINSESRDKSAVDDIEHTYSFQDTSDDEDYLLPDSAYSSE